MKKIVIFVISIIIIVSTVSYIYLKNIASNNIAKRENIQYVNYLNKEVNGGEIASLINKAIDSNKDNNIVTDENGNYIDNENNSINIDIKFMDNDQTYRMETLEKSGLDMFMKYYNAIKFKCMKIDYHKSTGKVKYMYIEQTSV